METLPKISNPVEVEKEAREEETIEIGQWFWVIDEEGADGPPANSPLEGSGWFGCVTEVGSNYVRINEPRAERLSYMQVRVHFDEIEERLVRELNPQAIIQATISHYQIKINHLMGEVKTITDRLGVSQHGMIAHQAPNEGKALAVISEQVDPNVHKQALIKAKDEDLPALFEEIKDTNRYIAKWMSAESLGLMAQTDLLQGSIKVIEKRIFGISLYAGLTEEIAQVRKGKSATFEDKVHLMQNMMYMDEECLMDYKAGGIDINNIEGFDKWISKKDNLERCLPFPKCVALFRVRRFAKDRHDMDETTIGSFIRIQLEQADMSTFMYIRNGKKLYRLSTDIDFGEKMFPDIGKFDIGEPLMVKMFGEQVEKLMPKREWDFLKDQHEEKKRKAKKWNRENPKKKWEKENPKQKWEWANPHHSGYGVGDRHDLDRYVSFNKSSVYFDDAMEKLSDEIEKFNRMALVLQGILDRSPILHPHPKVKAWSAEGFDQIFKMIYDASSVLTHGEAPDFVQYWKECNAQATKDSVFTGQEECWLMAEAEKECERRRNDWRDKSDFRPKYFKPYRNPGPGFVSKAFYFHPKAKKVTFSWFRGRINYTWRSDDDKIAARITLPLDKVFNVSAYKLGDYKKFFQDPRTRKDYIQWAPFLLAAEDYHNGKQHKVDYDYDD